MLSVGRCILILIISYQKSSSRLIYLTVIWLPAVFYLSVILMEVMINYFLKTPFWTIKLVIGKADGLSFPSRPLNSWTWFYNHLFHFTGCVHLFSLWPSSTFCLSLFKKINKTASLSIHVKPASCQRQRATSLSYFPSALLLEKSTSSPFTFSARALPHWSSSCCGILLSLSDCVL